MIRTLILLTAVLVGCSDTPIGTLCYKGVQYTVMQRDGLRPRYLWLSPRRIGNYEPVSCREQR